MNNDSFALDMEFGQVPVEISGSTSIEEMFKLADTLLLKQKKFKEAEEIFRRILEKEPDNIDAINSLAYCIKFEAASSDKSLSFDLYDTVLALYQRALEIDGDDIEANFNLGSLYLQFNRENEAALTAFEKCIAQNDGSEDGDLFRVQFAKSYYNIGLL